MARRVKHRHKEKPWQARRRRSGTEYFLGYYATKEEAEQVEREFDGRWPNVHPTKGKRRYQRSDGRIFYV